MKTQKRKGLNQNHLSKYKDEIETLKKENEMLEELIRMNQIMLSHATSKKVSQAFEIIDLKDKLVDYKLDIALLIFGIVFISLICIFK